MHNIARVIWGGLLALVLAGCATSHPKIPSYNDQDLRPINQDLVAWMQRMNADPKQAPAAASGRVASPSEPEAAYRSGTKLTTDIGAAPNTFRPATMVRATAAAQTAAGKVAKSPSARPGASGVASALPSTAYRCSAPIPAGALAPPGASSAWRVPAGTSFCQALWAFTSRANWSVVWEATGDGPALPEMAITGNFARALKELIRTAEPRGKPGTLRVDTEAKDQIVRVTNTTPNNGPLPEGGGHSPLDKALPWKNTEAGAEAKPSGAAPAPIAKPAAPAAVPSQTWTIKQGYGIQEQLTAMAEKAHWNVVWTYPNDIIAGSDWTSHDDFPTAAEKIISILAANGALIHYHTYTGNNTFRVYGTGGATP